MEKTNFAHRKEYAIKLIGERVEIKKLGFNPKEFAKKSKDKFSYVPLPEYGIGLFKTWT